MPSLYNRIAVSFCSVKEKKKKSFLNNSFPLSCEDEKLCISRVAAWARRKKVGGVGGENRHDETFKEENRSGEFSLNCEMSKRRIKMCC